VAKKSFTGALDILGQVNPYQARGDGEMLITPRLDQLTPDPDQPRRVAPDDLRERLLRGDIAPADAILEMWRRCLDDDLYEAMRSFEISPAGALETQRERGVRDWGMQMTLEGLVELADSIARHGLRQPINVYQVGDERYRIAEGERRWWAHVHLQAVLSLPDARHILARLHPLPGDGLAVLARQQAENAHRRDLSAIARARAIRQVRDAVAREVSGTPGSTNPEAAPSGQEVSGTQGSTNPGGRPRSLDGITVGDLDDLTGERLAELAGKGMSGRMVRHYLALLSLPPEAQVLAEAGGLTEKALRPITSLDDPAQQVRLARALVSGEMTPAQVAAEIKRLKGAGRQVKEDDGMRRLRSSLRFVAGDLPDPEQAATATAQLPPKKRAEIVDQARRYAAFLDAFLAAFSRTEGGSG
jgi:ParB-like chromosome segregation protein Spo0J